MPSSFVINKCALKAKDFTFGLELDFPYPPKYKMVPND